MHEIVATTQKTDKEIPQDDKDKESSENKICSSRLVENIAKRRRRTKTSEGTF